MLAEQKHLVLMRENPYMKLFVSMAIPHYLVHVTAPAEQLHFILGNDDGHIAFLPNDQRQRRS